MTPLRVLVVEDSEDDTLLLVREMHHGGYDVTHERVETADDMKAMLASGQWDVVISDYSMPRFSAPAALEVLRETGLDLPFLIVSGTVGEDVAVEAMKAGAHDYILKGNLTRLVPAVQREIEQAAHRSARRRLEAEHQKLLRAVEHSPASVVITDTAGNIEYVNPKFTRVTGYTREEVLGKNPRILRSGEMRPELYRELWETISAGGEWRGELHNRKKNGELFWEFASISPILDDRDRMTHFVAVKEDITDRKRVEEALYKSEKRFSVAFHANPIPTSISEIDTGRMLDANEQFLRAFGYERKEVIGRTSEELGLWADRAARDRVVEAIRRTGALFEAETRIRTRSGELRDILGSAVRIDLENARCVLTTFHDITARKRAEDALRASEQRFRSYFDLGLVGMATTTPAKGLIEVNGELCKILGYGRDELLTKTWAEMTHPDDLGADVANFDRVLTGEIDGYSMDKRWIRRDGRIVDSVISVKCIRREDGSVDHFVALVHDITERKKAENALKFQNLLLATLSDVALDGILVVDANARIVHYNRQFMRIMEIPEDVAAAGEDEAALQVVVGKMADPAGFLARVRYLYEHPEETSQEEIALKDGRTLERYSAPMSGADGSYYGRVWYFRDVSERKRDQEALAARERHFRSLIENAQDIITVLDLEGTIRFQSPAAARILGLPPSDFIGKSVFDFLHPEDASLVQASLSRASTSPGSTQSAVFRFRHSNGSWRTLEGIGKLIGEDSPQFVVNSRDVTESRAVEEQLRQAQKMEAVGRLAGGIAHDFNNLLTAILGYAQLAAARLKQEDPMRIELSEIEKAGQRAADLTRQLLAFSRKQVLQPRVISLNEIVGDTDKMLRRLIGEDIEFTTSLKDRLGSVRADTGQIEQVLVNLAVNSRDAMPKGGKLTIETSEVELDESYSAFHFDVQPGPYVLLAVSDTGTGMDANTLSHVFEPFFTTKTAEKGTGLGLSTVYGIVKQSGGHVAVYSELGVGTTFKIYLPRVEGLPERASGTFKRARKAGGTETVLVVEDEEAVRRLVCRSLEAHGYKTVPAASAAEALLACEKHAGEIHLMLTDVVMPHLSGRELAQRIAALRPRMKVLFMSGYTDNAIVHHGVLDAGMPFLQKPFTPRSVAQKVREVLDAPEQRPAV